MVYGQIMLKMGNSRHMRHVSFRHAATHSGFYQLGTFQLCQASTTYSESQDDPFVLALHTLVSVGGENPARL
jgi:hypothetical protein